MARSVNPKTITFTERVKNAGRWSKLLDEAMPELLKGMAVSIDIEPGDKASPKSAISALYGHWHKRSATRLYKRRLSIRKDTTGQFWMMAIPIEEGGGNDGDA